MSSFLTHITRSASSLGLLLTAVTMLVSCFGCHHSRQRMTISTDQAGYSGVEPYARIDVDEWIIQEGLAQLLHQVAQQVGPIDSTSLIKNYCPYIREHLYRAGFCTIRKLSFNGVTVDIHTYFQIDHPPPTLMMEAFLAGDAEPAFRLACTYFSDPSQS